MTGCGVHARHIIVNGMSSENVNTFINDVISLFSNLESTIIEMRKKKKMLFLETQIRAEFERSCKRRFSLSTLVSMLSACSPYMPYELQWCRLKYNECSNFAGKMIRHPGSNDVYDLSIYPIDSSTNKLFSDAQHRLIRFSRIDEFKAAIQKRENLDEIRSNLSFNSSVLSSSQLETAATNIALPKGSEKILPPLPFELKSLNILDVDASSLVGSQRRSIVNLAANAYVKEQMSARGQSPTREEGDLYPKPLGTPMSSIATPIKRESMFASMSPGATPLNANPNSINNKIMNGVAMAGRSASGGGGGPDQFSPFAGNLVGTPRHRSPSGGSSAGMMSVARSVSERSASSSAVREAMMARLRQRSGTPTHHSSQNGSQSGTKKGEIELTAEERADLRKKMAEEKEAAAKYKLMATVVKILANVIATDKNGASKVTFDSIIQDVLIKINTANISNGSRTLLKEELVTILNSMLSPSVSTSFAQAVGSITPCSSHSNISSMSPNLTSDSKFNANEMLEKKEDVTKEDSDDDDPLSYRSLFLKSNACNLCWIQKTTSGASLELLVLSGAPPATFRPSEGTNMGIFSRATSLKSVSSVGIIMSVELTKSAEMKEELIKKMETHPSDFIDRSRNIMTCDDNELRNAINKHDEEPDKATVVRQGVDDKNSERSRVIRSNPRQQLEGVDNDAHTMWTPVSTAALMADLDNDEDKKAAEFVEATDNLGKTPDENIPRTVVKGDNFLMTGAIKRSRINLTECLSEEEDPNDEAKSKRQKMHQIQLPDDDD